LSEDAADLRGAGAAARAEGTAGRGRVSLPADRRGGRRAHREAARGRLKPGRKPSQQPRGEQQMRASRLTALVAVVCLAVVAAGCGSSSNKSSSGTKSVPTTPSGGAKKGGTMTMLTSGDVDNSLDPGYSYYQYDFILDNDLHLTLLRYNPADTTKPSPDLAESFPTVSADGKTITVKLKH